VLPAAGAIAVVAPQSAVLQRHIGTKLTVAAGLVIVGAGLWQISQATTGSTYLDTAAGMVMLGIGAGLAIPATTASVMGSVPVGHTGIGCAANGAFLQVGGALGVAIIGSLLATRYQGRMSSALAPYHVPGAITHAILGSLGGALEAAAGAGGVMGVMLGQAARSAFISGMDLGLRTGAAVAILGGLLALATLPGRLDQGDDPRSEPPSA
jgi:hypothetical protein